MMTPQEIQKKVFSRVTFGGYDMQAVDEFLDTVYADYASLYKDNALLKSKMKVLIEKIEEYRKVDDAMRQTLISAQNMANEIVANAKQQSEQMTQTARAEAEKQIADYRAEAEQYRLKLERAKRETEQLIDNGIRACGGSLSMLETLKSELCGQNAQEQNGEQEQGGEQQEYNEHDQAEARETNNNTADEDTTSFEIEIGQPAGAQA